LKGRAEWVGGEFSKIRMKIEKEEIKLTTEASNNGYIIADEPLVDDTTLLKLAQKRVREKNAAIKSIFSFMAASIILFLLAVNNMRAQFHSGMYFGIWLTWGAMVAWRIWMTVILPFFRNLRSSAYDPVEAEYYKLKKMPREKLVTECEKL
jgi:hypothetical protein